MYSMSNVRGKRSANEAPYVPDGRQWLPVLYVLVILVAMGICTGFSLSHLIFIGGSSGETAMKTRPHENTFRECPEYLLLKI